MATRNDSRTPAEFKLRETIIIEGIHTMTAEEVGSIDSTIEDFIEAEKELLREDPVGFITRMIGSGNATLNFNFVPVSE